MKTYSLNVENFRTHLDKSNDDAMAKLNKWIYSERSRIIIEAISDELGKVWHDRLNRNGLKWARWMKICMIFRGLIFHEVEMPANGPYPAQNLFIVLKRNMVIRIVRLP